MLLNLFVSAQKNTGERAQWFVNDRFGMFIHWGLYSSAEGVWKGEELRNNNQYAEWIQYRNRIPTEEYLNLLDRFDWENINPEEWVLLAKESGMKYITLTAKHHDGFALWNSQTSDYNIYNKSKKNRDIVKELAIACKKHGIKLGLYYSHWIDWHDPKSWDHTKEIYGLNPKLFDQYWQEKVIPQMTELLTNYGEISIIWFDMWIHHSKTVVTKNQLFQLKNLIRKLQPKCLINSRLGLSIDEDSDVDFRTLQDNQLGKEKFEYPWQTPATIAHSWGFNLNETKWKSTTSILKALIGNVSLNGNLMLNIGPRLDGSIRYESESRLNDIGDWLKINGASIYGSGAYDLSSNIHSWGQMTYKKSPNNNKIFLHVYKWPLNNEIKVYGIKSKPDKIYSLSDKSKEPLLFYHQDVMTKINIPREPFNNYISVIVMEYNQPPKSEKGLVGKNFEQGYSLNLENYSNYSNKKIVNKKSRYGTIPKNILIQNQEKINWKIYIDKPGKYYFDSSYSNQSNHEVGSLEINVDGKSIKKKFKPTGKTVGEPLQNWEIKNFKSHRIGEIEFGESGIYKVSVDLKTNSKNPVSWQWLWLGYND
tara:strand:+ start:2920 stop:4692 length:1773 start_codon:yes stop_codon:yes gene_type:complete